jgi:ferredoxin
MSDMPHRHGHVDETLMAEPRLSPMQRETTPAHRGDGVYARFYVEEDLCIGCGLCRERAPENMDIPRGASAARVIRQPESAEEEAACRDAAEYCPTGGLLVEE